jgi:hypothetical protein
MDLTSSHRHALRVLYHAHGRHHVGIDHYTSVPMSGHRFPVVHWLTAQELILAGLAEQHHVCIRLTDTGLETAETVKP